MNPSTLSRISAVLNPVNSTGRAAARRCGLDPDDGAGIALLALCQVAGRYNGPEDQWPGYAILAARRAVSRAASRDRRAVAGRVYPDLGEVAAPEPVPAPDIDAVLRIAERVLGDLGIIGALTTEVVIEGRSVDQTAARYMLPPAAVRRSVREGLDALRARFTD